MATLIKKPECKIMWDTAGLFQPGQIITGSHYDSVKEDYDIRMKDWVSDSQPAVGEGTVHISGRKRDSIKSFLEEKRYGITSEYYHYEVRARGKRIDPTVISQKVQELGLKFLWVHVIGETGPDSGSDKMRSR
jgi:hypothetical protein